MKKLVVIFCLIALTAINLFSQKPCKVLKQEIAGKYEGKCKKGLAHKNGVAIGIDKYEGQFKNGLPFGNGKYTWASGEVYVGMWKEGKRDGEGKLYYKINGVDSVKGGIWENDILVKRSTPDPYRIIRSISVSRYTVQRKKEGNRVLFSFRQNGRQNSNVKILLFTPSSGSSYNNGILQGFENITFPFTCKIIYNTPSASKTKVYFISAYNIRLRNATQKMNNPNELNTDVYNVEFEIVIREPGDWEIVLNNI